MSGVHTCVLTCHSIWTVKERALKLLVGLQQGLENTSNLASSWCLEINLAYFSSLCLLLHCFVLTSLDGNALTYAVLLFCTAAFTTGFLSSDLIVPLSAFCHPFHWTFWMKCSMWHPFFLLPQIQVWPSSHVQQSGQCQDSKVFKTHSVATSAVGSLHASVWWSDCSRYL